MRRFTIAGLILGAVVLAWAAVLAVAGASGSKHASSQVTIAPRALPAEAWDHPLIGQVDSTQDVALKSVPFHAVVPPATLGTPDIIGASPYGIVWVYHEDGTTIDVLEQAANGASPSSLESRVTCQPDEVGCVSDGRGLTTLKDGSTAYWAHYPNATNVTWITGGDIYIKVIGPYDTLSLDRALEVANTIASS